MMNRQPLTISHDYQAKAGEIWLYDEIGDYGVTARNFIADLASNEAEEITLRINSPGGDVFDGMAMFNAIRNESRPVHVVIDGLAASAASYIALAGDSVTMASNAFMMIHNAWGVVMGNASDMRATADTLEKIDGQIAAMYAGKSSGKADDFRVMMEAETWFTAKEARDAGLVDAIEERDDAPRSLFDLSVFRNAPAPLKRRVENHLLKAGYSQEQAKLAVSKGLARCREGSEENDHREGEAILQILDRIQAVFA